MAYDPVYNARYKREHREQVNKDCRERARKNGGKWQKAFKKKNPNYNHEYYLRHKERLLAAAKVYAHKRGVETGWISVKLYREGHKKEYAAGNTARASVSLRNRSCEVCDSTKTLQRHHHNYDLATDVIILCVKCHNKLHRLVGREGIGKYPTGPSVRELFMTSI